MFVGVLRISLGIVSARSLKDKRRVIQSFKERIAARLRVSVAEVGNLDDPRYAHLGIAVVSNEAAHCDSVMAEVGHQANTLGDAILIDKASEIVPFGLGGASLRANLGESLGGLDDSSDDDKEDSDAER